MSRARITVYIVYGWLAFFGSLAMASCDEIVIAFFPASAFGHVRLEYDGHLWEVNGNGGVRRRIRISTAKATSEPIMRFAIDISDEEFRSIKSYIENDPHKYGSCMEGACAIVSETTGIRFPPIVRKFPGLNLTYSMLRRKFSRNPRIKSVEMYGQGSQPFYHKILFKEAK